MLEKLAVADLFRKVDSELEQPQLLYDDAKDKAGLTRL